MPKAGKLVMRKSEKPSKGSKSKGAVAKVHKKPSKKDRKKDRKVAARNTEVDSEEEDEPVEEPEPGDEGEEGEHEDEEEDEEEDEGEEEEGEEEEEEEGEEEEDKEKMRAKRARQVVLDKKEAGRMRGYRGNARRSGFDTTGASDSLTNIIPVSAVLKAARSAPSRDFLENNAIFESPEAFRTYYKTLKAACPGRAMEVFRASGEKIFRKIVLDAARLAALSSVSSQSKTVKITVHHLEEAARPLRESLYVYDSLPLPLVRHCQAKERIVKLRVKPEKKRTISKVEAVRSVLPITREIKKKLESKDKNIVSKQKAIMKEIDAEIQKKQSEKTSATS